MRIKLESFRNFFYVNKKSVADCIQSRQPKKLHLKSFLKIELTDFFVCNTMVLGQNSSFYLSQRLKYSCKYLTYKEWKTFILHQ